MLNSPVCWLCLACLSHPWLFGALFRCFLSFFALLNLVSPPRIHRTAMTFFIRSLFCTHIQPVFHHLQVLTIDALVITSSSVVRFRSSAIASAAISATWIVWMVWGSLISVSVLLGLVRMKFRCIKCVHRESRYYCMPYKSSYTLSLKGKVEDF